jgi:poly-gamma-glutamate capsule biosynthesis protein CapA/YwtB (metallophosphatase superfamily)
MTYGSSSVRRGLAFLSVLVIAGAALAISLTPGRPDASAAASPGSSVAASPVAASSAAAPSSSPSSSSAPSSPQVAAVPVVPVVTYRSAAGSIGPTEVAALVAGTGITWHALELVADQADPILAALGTTRTALGGRLVEARDAATLMADLAKHRDRLAFLRADEVGPGVRAIAWGGRQLFGVHRRTSLADWPLSAALPDRVGTVAPYDPATTWTMFAAGDLGLDRNYAYVVKNLRKGMDYPFDGGTARIAGLVCCSSFDWPVPTIKSTGHAGAMRDLISSADIALANMEESAPDNYVFHPKGTSFTGDPALLAGVARAGIDVVSTASTHIGDGGRAGILQTLRSLDKYGIANFGAGKNLAAARKPAIFEMGGVKVAILGYDSISAKWYAATPTTTGSAPLVASYVKADVAAARRAGAAVVIVFPHWGIEYTSGPSAYQQRMAHLMIDAGADIVIGNHPHWVQAMEIYKGRPIWYALGNFTFDQSWSEPTLEGITLELTFRGGTLVQARINPHILVLAVQPNLLDPGGDGQRVLGPLFKASAKLLPW